MVSPAAFLFLDECSHEGLDLAALTGVLIPLTAYGSVRDELCQITWDILQPPPNTVPGVIELHARDLLSALDTPNVCHGIDTLKLGVYKSVVGIVNNWRLKVFRVAYLNHREITSILRGDPNLYGLNFFGIQAQLQSVMASTLVIPVMDGIPGCKSDAQRPPRIDPQLIRAFAQQVRWIHHARRLNGAENMISIENVENLAEPMFADSEHCVMLQLVDLVSYLLLQQERKEFEVTPNIGEFRGELLRIASELDAELIVHWKGRMKYKGDTPTQT